MESTIIGKTFVIKIRHANKDEFKNRTIKIDGEIVQDGKRMYQVSEAGHASFTAIADIYDRFFNVRKLDIRPKNYREDIGSSQRRVKREI